MTNEETCKKKRIKYNSLLHNSTINHILKIDSDTMYGGFFLRGSELPFIGGIKFTHLSVTKGN